VGSDIGIYDTSDQEALFSQLLFWTWTHLFAVAGRSVAELDADSGTAARLEKLSPFVIPFSLHLPR
jgi:hypothetical protein